MDLKATNSLVLMDSILKASTKKYWTVETFWCPLKSHSVELDRRISYGEYLDEKLVTPDHRR
jgi:hypothetical protein